MDWTLFLSELPDPPGCPVAIPAPDLSMFKVLPGRPALVPERVHQVAGATRLEGLFDSLVAAAVSPHTGAPESSPAADGALRKGTLMAALRAGAPTVAPPPNSGGFGGGGFGASGAAAGAAAHGSASATAESLMAQYRQRTATSIGSALASPVSLPRPGGGDGLFSPSSSAASPSSSSATPSSAAAAASPFSADGPKMAPSNSFSGDPRALGSAGSARTLKRPISARITGLVAPVGRSAPYSQEALLKVMRREVKLPEEFQKAMSSLFSMTLSDANSCVDNALQTLVDPGAAAAKKAGKKVKPPKLAVKLDKYALSFGISSAMAAPLNTKLVESVTITNIGVLPVTYEVHVPPAQKSFVTHSSKEGGTIKKGCSDVIHLDITVQSTMHLREVISIDVIGLGRVVLPVMFTSETSVFGVDPGELEFVEDSGFSVPKPLVLLKNCLLSNGGLEKEDIFRNSGAPDAVNEIRTQLNEEKFTEHRDLHAVAAVIKTFYAELPSALLHGGEPKGIEEYGTTDPMRVYESMKDPYRSLLGWLMELLAIATLFAEVTHMSPKVLSRIVSPNLIDASSVPPAQSMAYSQRAVNFITALLEAWIARNRGSVGSIDVLPPVAASAAAAPVAASPVVASPIVAAPSELVNLPEPAEPADSGLPPTAVCAVAAIGGLNST